MKLLMCSTIASEKRSGSAKCEGEKGCSTSTTSNAKHLRTAAKPTVGSSNLEKSLYTGACWYLRLKTQEDLRMIASMDMNTSTFFEKPWQPGTVGSAFLNDAVRRDKRAFERLMHVQ